MITGIWIAFVIVSALLGFAIGVYAGATWTDGEFTKYDDD